MTSKQLSAYWKDRALAIGQAQARYLWTLLVLGIFFWSLQGSTEADAFTIPGVGVALDANVVRAAGPLVIFLLIVVIHGTFRAYGDALGELGLRRDPKWAPTARHHKLAEAIDASPNPLDFAAYTRGKWRWSLRTLLLLNYPIYLGIFIVEGVFLWLALSPIQGSPPEARFMVSIGAILGIVAIIQTASLTWVRLQRIWAIYSRGRRTSA